VYTFADRLNDAIHYNSDGDVDVEELVDVIVEEFEDIMNRLDALEQSEEIEADRRAKLTTAERCREDNERI